MNEPSGSLQVTSTWVPLGASEQLPSMLRMYLSVMPLRNTTRRGT